MPSLQQVAQLMHNHIFQTFLGVSAKIGTEPYPLILNITTSPTGLHLAHPSRLGSHAQERLPSIKIRVHQRLYTLGIGRDHRLPLLLDNPIRPCRHKSINCLTTDPIRRCYYHLSVTDPNVNMFDCLSYQLIFHTSS